MLGGTFFERMKDEGDRRKDTEDTLTIVCNFWALNLKDYFWLISHWFLPMPEGGTELLLLFRPNL